ncbi:Na+/H+ antiporter subunit G [Opacimonas viscosa]|uniref:Na+/H+ antiporter subunit G n=1 Tax=Opacimonas viscosa TaxID=2961944 RepID=A0AA41X4N7_9ALTE|nr:Na+/H+ antiporter subunit G [Opacimonas viscosa]MCP3429411.1 Na+/H+ antiporter subunit G [Opacimonas viscosa]
MVFEIIISVLLIIGGLFILIGSLGLLRLPDFYTRLHAPTKATTLGLGSVLLASMVFTYKIEGYISVNELLITLFLVITAPVVAHILAKVGFHHQVKMTANTRNQELVKVARVRGKPQNKIEE